jgi:hypothetical protein
MGEKKDGEGERAKPTLILINLALKTCWEM